MTQSIPRPFTGARVTLLLAVTCGLCLTASAGEVTQSAEELHPTQEPRPARAADTNDTARSKDATEPQDSSERVRAYLARNPFHERLFDELVAAAALEGTALEGTVLEGTVLEGTVLEGTVLEALAATYKVELDADPRALAPRVLLARLTARRGAYDEARQILVEALANPDGRARELERLLAELELESGHLDAARRRLTWLVADAARREGATGPSGAGSLSERAASLPERDRHEALLEDLAEAHALAGDLDGVRAAFEALATLIGGDVAGRLRVAALCADQGLGPEAELHLRHAVDLTRGDTSDATQGAASDTLVTVADTARRCDALAALGRHLEGRHDGEGALAAYDEASGLLAQGHWLRRELDTRSLALRQRGGTLGAWLAALEVRVAVGSPDAVQDLADAYEMLGRAREATELLAERAAAPGAARELQDRFLALARSAERMDLALPLLQRRASDTAVRAHALQRGRGSSPATGVPLEGVPGGGPELARAELALFEDFLTAELPDAARLALARAETALDSPDDLPLLLNVATRRVALGDLDGAEATLARAVRLAPADTAPWYDLAQLAATRGDDAAHDAALARVGELARGQEQIGLAQRWLARGREAEAEAVLRAALSEPEARIAALAALADHLLQRAADPAHSQPADAGAAIVPAAPNAPSAALEAGVESPDAAARRSRDLAEARDHLRSLCAESRGVARADAIETLARTYETKDERERAILLDEALAELQRVERELAQPEFKLDVMQRVEARHGASIVLTHKIGRIHARLGQRAEAVARGKQLHALGAPELMIETYFTDCECKEEYVEWAATLSIVQDDAADKQR